MVLVPNTDGLDDSDALAEALPDRDGVAVDEKLSVDDGLAEIDWVTDSLELSVVDSDALVDTEGDGDMNHVELLVVVTLSDGLVESEWDSDCILSAV